MIQNIFRTPVYVTQLKLDNNKIYKDCLKWQKDLKKGNQISNRGGYQSHNLTNKNIDSFSNLANTIAEHAGIFSKEINLEVKVLRDLWFNINYKKDYNVSHNHFGNNNKFSGVYYVKAPKNCGHIVLEHPANLVELSWAEKVPKGQHNEYTGSIWTYNPLPGKLLIFPSWLDHRVEPNLSKSPRVSFSFNIE